MVVVVVVVVGQVVVVIVVVVVVVVVAVKSNQVHQQSPQFDIKSEYLYRYFYWSKLIVEFLTCGCCSGGSFTLVVAINVCQFSCRKTIRQAGISSGIQNLSNDGTAQITLIVPIRVFRFSIRTATDQAFITSRIENFSSNGTIW